MKNQTSFKDRFEGLCILLACSTAIIVIINLIEMFVDSIVI